MNTPTTWELLKETYKSWDEDRAPRLAAALAYYTIFALAPLLIIAIAVAALFFDEAHVRHSILTELGGLIGKNGQQALEMMIDGARKPTTGLIATAIGVVTLLVAAGGLFGQLQDALNTIWEVQPKPGRGIWGMLRDRFFSFAMVLGSGFLLLVTLLISTALAAVGQWAVGTAYGETQMWRAISFVVSFGVTTVLFAMIFKILPDAKVRWRDVWIGAAATAALFSLGRFLIGWYLGQAATESTYGAAGSLVALLIWIYYSTQILFLGAEFTQVYARTYGSKIEPTENAVRVTEPERIQQGMPSQEKVAAATAPHTVVSQASGALWPTTGTPVAGAILAFMVGVLLGWQRKPPPAR
ncbi:MAG: YihY/virulence factor BrkB family protein [Candidatus Competibacteraceae bacterium]|nr:YihY/virulence factor BrkB family protein [Candidatus Competibacteraceae bacterium]MBK8964636.1 YihY/virulence factor BrkB family protein [Candidatus Competibacteraceae bacterium]